MSKEVRILPSDPDFEHIDDAAREVAARTNPQAHWNGRNEDPTQPEFKAELQFAKDEQEGLLESHEVFSQAADVAGKA